MTDREFTLLDIIDRAQLQALQDSFANATGMAALTTDMTGPVTRLSNPTDFCVKYTRRSKVGCERCNECDLKGGAMAQNSGKPAVYTCHAGLLDFAAPIIINGRQIGSLIGGQVMTKEPDEDELREIATELNINPDDYIEAAKNVKIVSEKQVNYAADLLFKMAQALSEVGYQRYIIEKDKAQNDIYFSEVHTDFRIISKDINDVNGSIKELSEEFDRLRSKTAESAAAVNQTDKILNYIRTVSTLMTLLGFNASIEAKHAGDAGAGFNVIAQEVRRLAEEANEKTHSIEEMLNTVKTSIESIEQELSAAVEKMKLNAETVKQLSDTIVDTREKLDKISD